MEPLSKEQLELMIDLQEDETEGARIQSELDRLPQQLAEMDKSLSSHEENLANLKSALDELKKNYRKLESDLETNQARIQKREAQLSSVKTNKEYQGLLKEIAEIKSGNSRIEDDILKCLDDIDAVSAEIGGEEKVYAAEKQKVESEKEEIGKKADEQRKKLEQLQSDITATADQLPQKLRKTYYNIKERSGGLAIVPVEDAVCKGCHLNIPPQMYNELHRGSELRFCPHCYRIIYVV